MSIKMLTPAFARIGYIKIGAKGGGGAGPVKFDHFEIRTVFKDAQGNLLPDFPMMERLGPHPMSLKIRLPFNDIDLVFSSMLAYYRGHNRFCWGDGETAQRLTEMGTGKGARFGAAVPFGPCGEQCPDFQNRRCKPLGALQVILEDQQQVGGAYVFKTSSWNSIRNIATALAAIKAQTGGYLAWVPLTMKLVPQIVQPKDGSPANTAYIVQIVFDGSPQQLLTTVRDLYAMRAPLIQEIRALEASLKALPPAEEDAEEAADTQDEFYYDQKAVPVQESSSGTAQPLPPPTPEEVDALLKLLVEVYVEKDVVRQRLREVMAISAEQETIGQRWLYKHMMGEHYQQLKSDAVAYETANIAASEVEDDDEDIDILAEPIATDTDDIPLDDEAEAHLRSIQSETTLTHKQTAQETPESTIVATSESMVAPDAEVVTTPPADTQEGHTSGDDGMAFRPLATDAEGHVVRAHMTELHQFAYEHKQTALLESMLAETPEMIPGRYRYCWVQIAQKAGV